MAGFLLNLKNKVQKPGKPGNKLLKRGTVDKLQKNLLGDDDLNQDSKTSIDAFLKKGAMAGDLAVNEDKVLIIKPSNLSTGLIRHKKASATSRYVSSSVEDQARSSIIKNDLISDSGLVIKNDDAEGSDMSEEDYDKVPVDLFGAALLRGMGWDGKDDTEADSSLQHRQRGALLGIGSKPIDKDLEKDILGDRNTKLLVPLKKRES